MFKEEVTPEIALMIAEDLEYSLKNPLIQKDQEDIEAYRGLYNKVTQFHNGKYKHLLDKINSLKYGKEAIKEATEKQLRRTFNICISRSKEDKEYYKENKEFMKELYDRLLELDKSCWYDYRDVTLELPDDE
jgi:t-SNARE complex subunit (syntaxin)